MRLIDKDNLRKPSKGMFIYQDEFEDDVQHVAFEAYTKDDIEREPTVQAIPIEWMYLWRIRNMDKCPVNLMPFDVMLEDWEKENANNN